MKIRSKYAPNDDLMRSFYFKNQEKEACFCIDLEYHPEILDSYLEKEDEPYVFTGKERLDKQYANNIKISRALKAFQKDWEAM